MFSWKHPPNRPIIVAHRGSSLRAPENTLAAFRRALYDGADAIELDVRLTNDGELVVIHDARLQRTTNGRGIVERHSLDELKRLSAGAWFHRSFSSEKIPTLDEVLRLLRGRMGVNIELKAGRRLRKNSGLVDKTCAVIRQHGAEQYVLVSSFHHSLVTEVKRRLPSVATGLLFHPLKRPRSSVKLAGRTNAEYLIFSGSSLRKSIVRKAHEDHLYVGEFTLDTKRRFARAVRFGVDAVITNEPARFK